MKQMGMDPKQMEGGQKMTIYSCFSWKVLEDVYLSVGCEGRGMLIRYDIPICLFSHAAMN